MFINDKKKKKLEVCKGEHGGILRGKQSQERQWFSLLSYRMRETYISVVAYKYLQAVKWSVRKIFERENIADANKSSWEGLRTSVQYIVIAQ